jgi:hypothetical protein
MDDTGWGDLGTPEGVLTAFRKTVNAAAGSENPATPAEAVRPVESPDAFDVWLDAYRRRMEAICEPYGAKAVRAERRN